MQCMYECNRRLRSMLNAMHNKNTVRAFKRNNISFLISFPAKPSLRGDFSKHGSISITTRNQIESQMKSIHLFKVEFEFQSVSV